MNSKIATECKVIHLDDNEKFEYVGKKYKFKLPSAYPQVCECTNTNTYTVKGAEEFNVYVRQIEDMFIEAYKMGVSKESDCLRLLGVKAIWNLYKWYKVKSGSTRYPHDTTSTRMLALLDLGYTRYQCGGTGLFKYIDSLGEAMKEMSEGMRNVYRDGDKSNHFKARAKGREKSLKAISSELRDGYFDLEK